MQTRTSAFGNCSLLITSHNVEGLRQRDMVVSDDDEEQQHAWEEENASQEYPIQIPWIIRFPLRLVTASVGSSLRLIRPYTTQLIPLVILTLTIPLLVTLSLSSGWMVWRRIAVGWDTELYLQYG